MLTPTDTDLLEDDGFCLLKMELDIGINNSVPFEQGPLPTMTSPIPKGSPIGQEEYPTIWDDKDMHCCLVNNGHDHKVEVFQQI